MEKTKKKTIEQSGVRKGGWKGNVIHPVINIVIQQYTYCDVRWYYW